MSEEMFFLFQAVINMLAGVLSAFCLLFFFWPFLTGKRVRKALLVVSAYLVPYFLCDGTIIPGASVLLTMGILLAVSSFLEMKPAGTFLTAVLYYGVKMSSGLMIGSLQLAFDRWLPEPGFEQIYLRSTGVVTLALMVNGILLTALLYGLRKRLLKLHGPLSWQTLCYLSLLPVLNFLFGRIIASLLFEVKDGVYLQLYQRHPVFFILVPFMAFLFYGGIYCTVLFQKHMEVLREEQALHFVKEQQVQAIRERVSEAERFYADIRGMKHELRGHLTNMKGLVHSGEYAGLESYILRMDKSIRDFDLTLQTGNPVTDVIVNDIRQQCQRLEILFHLDFHYPDPHAFDVFDLGIILQNLLQNAVEACEGLADGQRMITLKGKRRGRFFLIETTNSYAGEIKFGQDGLPVTTKKREIPLHGIGLSNVRREAEKYRGELEIRTSQQMFYATVLLQGK